MRHSGFPPLTLALALALTAAGFTLPALTQSLSAPLGTGATTTVTFSFTAPTTAVGAIAVTTQGVSNQDFTRDAATPGTCATTVYNSGASCTVIVDFTPKAVGPRAGAVVLFDASNRPLQTAYLSGGGVGPLVTFDQAPTSSGAVTPAGAGSLALAPVQMLLDPAGDLFIADGTYNQNDVVEVQPNATVTRLGAGLDVNPIEGEALDGAGNLYLLFTDALFEIPNQNGTLVSTAAARIYTAPTNDVLTGVAVDGAGNLYIADSSAGLFELAAQTRARTQIATGVLPTSAILVAADALGNVWASDSSCNVYKIPAAGAGTLAVAGASACISGMAVDPAGDLLFTSGAAGGSVYEVHADGSRSTIAPEASGDNAYAPAFDSAGNVYFASSDPSNNYTVLEVMRTAPAVAFSNVVLGNSSPVQTVTVGNAGNAALTGLAATLANANPIPSQFTFQAGGSAPCGASLPVGASCSFEAQYTPTTSGNASVNASIADNAAHAPQILALSGSSYSGPAKLAFAVAPPSTATAPATLGTVTVEVENAIGAVLASSDSIQVNIRVAGYDLTASGTAGQPISLNSLTLPYGATYTVTAADTTDLTVKPAIATVVVSSPAVAVGQTARQGGGAGSLNVTQVVTFTFGTTPEKIGGIGVTTFGVSGADFTRDPADTGIGACAIGASYQNTTCSVMVDFAPRAPGLRAGAVTLTTNAPAPDTAYMSRVGAAPLATVDVAAPSPIVFATNVQGTALALDGRSDLYVADAANQQVVEQVNPAYCSSNCRELVSAGTWSRPTGIAVDGAGTLYVADAGVGSIVALASGSATQVQLASPPSSAAPIALASNPAGLLYISNSASQMLSEVCDLNAVCTLPAAQTGLGANLSALVVDAAGDVFFPGSGSVEELAAGSSSPTAIATGFTGPLSLALDAAGDIYVMDGGAGKLTEIAAGGRQTVLLSGLQASAALAGVAVDSAGNVYVADLAHSRVLELQRSAAALSFASTYGSTAQATATVSNSGNATLTLSGLTVSGAGFSQVSSGGTDCGASSAVSTGQSCAIAIALAASAPAGTASGSVNIADNSNHNAGVSQTVSLSGSITPAPLTITAWSGSVTYGGTVPDVTALYSGFQNSDSATSLTAAPQCSTTAAGAPAVGTYPTSCSGAVDINYTIAYASGTLTVSPAPLTVAANNVARAYGAANPAFTDSVTGFVNGDTAAVVSGAPSLTTTATPSSPVGSYAITVAPGTLAAANYSFQFQAGTLTVEPRSQTIQFTLPSTAVYGAAPLTLNATASSGLAVTYRVVSGPASLSGGALTLSGAGAVVVEADQAGNADYQAAPAVRQTLPVARAALTVAANNATMTVGAASLPQFTGTITGAVNHDSFTETFTTTATASSPAGAYPITPSASGPGLANYTVTVRPGTLTIVTAPNPLALAPRLLAFGAVAVGNSKMQTVAINNTSSSGLTGVAVTSSAPFHSDQCPATLAPGASCTVAVTFAPLAAGAQSGALTVSAADGWSSSIALSGTGSDFSLSAGAAPSITAGKSATIPLSLQSVAGDAQTVALTCGVTGTGTSCSVAPNSVALSGTAIAAATLTVNTSASTAIAPPPGARPWPWVLLVVFVFSLAPWLLLADGRTRQLKRRWKVALVAGAMALTAACGGGGGGAGPGGTTPPGNAAPASTTITVTVTATSSTGVVHTVPVVVTVDSN